MDVSQDRRQKLTAEIRQRLESVCSNLTEPDFQSLIDKIADNYLKADARAVRSIATGRKDLSRNGRQGL